MQSCDTYIVYVTNLIQSDSCMFRDAPQKSWVGYLEIKFEAQQKNSDSLSQFEILK